MAYKDPERGRAYGREWTRRNPEKAREAMRRWRQRHPEARRLGDKQYRERYPEKRAAAMERYNARHPEVRETIHRNRRARELGAEGSFTRHEWLDLVQMVGSCCSYCGSAGPLEADHRTPLARGGTNYIENITPACGPCNRRKATRTETEFRDYLARKSIPPID